MMPIIEYILENDSITNECGRTLTGKSAATSKRYLRRLCEVGLIEATGATKNTVYRRRK
jgi:ATP-dependent DNA helicase RecG